MCYSWNLLHIFMIYEISNDYCNNIKNFNRSDYLSHIFGIIESYDRFGLSAQYKETSHNRLNVN